MAEKVADSGSRPGATLSAWLFNPFVYIAGGWSLALGVGAILLSACIGFAGKTHFDGVLDVHTGRAAPLGPFIIEGIANWLALSMALLVAGKTVSRTEFRAVDVLGTQALARWPLLLVAAAALAPPYQRFAAALARQLAGRGGGLSFSGADGAVAGLVMLVTVFAVVWMVALMYRAYSLCCNVRGGRAISSFIIALVAAEVISKVVALRLLAG